MTVSFKTPQLSGLEVDVTRPQEQVIGASIGGLDTSVRTQQFLQGLDALSKGIGALSKWNEIRSANNDIIMARTLFEQGKQLPGSASRTAEAAYDKMSAEKFTNKGLSKIIAGNEGLMAVSLNSTDDTGVNNTFEARQEHFQIALAEKIRAFLTGANFTPVQAESVRERIEKTQLVLEGDFLKRNVAVMVDKKKVVAKTAYAASLEHLFGMSEFRDKLKYPKRDDFLRDHITTKELVNFRNGINEALGGGLLKNTLERHELDAAMLDMAERFFLAHDDIDPKIFEDLVNTPLDKKSGVSLATSTLSKEAAGAVSAVNKAYQNREKKENKLSKELRIAREKAAEEAVGSQIFDLRNAGIILDESDLLSYFASASTCASCSSLILLWRLS